MTYKINSSISLNHSQVSKFVNALNSRERITGLTHNFYNYPARFSPLFAREAIRTFTDVGDLVIDPFVGGGTTLTEARSLGRRALGTDLNELAIFISKVKSTLLSNAEAQELQRWCNRLPDQLTLNKPVKTVNDESCHRYLRNFSTRQLWPIRKTIELGINQTNNLSSKKLQNFARCILLKAGQWAVDGRKVIRSAKELRHKIPEFGFDMIEASLAYTSEVRKADSLSKSTYKRRTRCINTSAENISNHVDILADRAPKLILTSPPYPGVHVLYHRWQINGGKETGAPYWITNKSDGFGASYYTFGDRQSKTLESYYFNLLKIFTNIKSIADENTIIIQLVAFSDYQCQLQRYLDTMSEAGFKEIKLSKYSDYEDARMWRDVPNRKWHANFKGATSSANEVVLMHTIK